MQNVNSIGSRVAAMFGASAITALMLFAYFPNPGHPYSVIAAIGLIA